MQEHDDGLLVGISAPFFRHDGQLHVERQTILGLAAWRANFGRVTAFSICHDAPAPQGWEPWPEGGPADGIALVPLPDTYRPRILLRQRRSVARQLLQLMRTHRYRTFAYGGWLGDPGEIAASTARANGLSHGVWFDRVESQVAVAEAGGPEKLGLKARLRRAIFVFHENRAVRHAQLSLLHGASVFRHFQPIAKNPHQVEDIHFTDADFIDEAALAEKQAAVATGPLQILYCGRAAPMKGPEDWIAALIQLKRRGIAFHARWLGDGEMLAQMKAAAQEGGLDETDLTFDGFVADPQRVRDAYRAAHLLLFCHKSDESPRNLIESLHSGTPLIGYRDPYSAELVAEKDAGILVPRGDVGALAQAVAALDADRDRLSQLVGRAGRSARHLTRDAVFRHRSTIIRHQLDQQREPRS
ncbi:glycosyltransferase [Paracoccus tibetensis]|uniref:Glycosyltransferase involved in cell wall bisynthesis n=1 Tax=Paracoccus tibetensis TaxID=336292 RepID=A0A1G5FG13_9RHOB|nr:glycosyltransferase [Paracoccus tibetensis]SCY38209.1 Glycosyltransferase involved in cell wall bisynthesis [Paracoccus tibetensis]